VSAKRSPKASTVSVKSIVNVGDPKSKLAPSSSAIKSPSSVLNSALPAPKLPPS
jgi:hypothetical protein